MIQSTPHPAKPGFRTLANPIKLDGRRLAGEVGSALGADTEAVLRSVGYDDGAIEQLRRDQVI